MEQMADPRFTNGGGKDEVPGGWVRGGCVPSPFATSPENFPILDLKMAIIVAFWALFFTVQLFGLNAKTSSRG